jgi:hypothetical protein
MVEYALKIFSRGGKKGSIWPQSEFPEQKKVSSRDKLVTTSVADSSTGMPETHRREMTSEWFMLANLQLAAGNWRGRGLEVEAVQPQSFRGSKSRNKVSVGEAA